MATEIGALRALLSASIAEFEKDMGKAADAVGKFEKRFNAYGKAFAKAGAVMSLAITAPIVAFGSKALAAFKESENAAADVNAVLATMGQRAGFTSQQLQDMAAGLQATTRFGDDEILSKVTANLLTFGNVSGDVFRRAQEAALDLSQRLGTDLQSSAIQLGKALNDPIKGVTALTRVGVSFTAAQKDTIKALVETGRTAEAQDLILKELERQYGNVAEAAAQTTSGQLDQLANQWNDVEEEIGKLIAEFLPPLIEMLKEVVAWVRDLTPEQKKWAIEIAGVAAAIGPLLIGLGSLSFALSGIATVIRVVLIPAFAALLAHPIIAGAVIIGAGIGYLIDQFNDADEATKRWHKSMDDLLATVRLVAGIANGTIKAELADPNYKLPATPDALMAALAPQGPVAAADTLEEAGIGDKPRQKISEFKAGLNDARRAAEEAKKAIKDLAEATVDASRSVRDFGGGGLAPLEQRLADVKDRYDDIKKSIEEQITEHAKLGAKNAEAAASIAKLKQSLVDLEGAYKSATEATKAQYAAEQTLADMRAARDASEVKAQMADLARAGGDGGVLTESMARVQEAERKLADLRISNTERQAQWEMSYDAAVRANDTAEAQRLLVLIELAKQLGVQLEATSGQQMADQTRIADAFSQFADDLSNEITDMILDWKFDLEGLRNVWKQLARDLFIKPFTDSVTSGLGSFLKQFAGGHAAGGTLAPGEWGFAGEEGVEPIFAGRRPLHVIPHEDMAKGSGGVTVVQNITTPDYGAFRSNRRQMARQAKEAMGA